MGDGRSLNLFIFDFGSKFVRNNCIGLELCFVINSYVFVLFFLVM